MPNQGTIDLAPKDLEGRRALVEIRPAEFENAEGQVVRRNEVPYDGYRAADDGDSSEAGSRNIEGRDTDDGYTEAGDADQDEASPAADRRDIPF